jgi:phage/plasmid primase-like uncharacterized protein
MIPAHIIERARAVRLEDEIARRGIKLKGKVDRSGPCPACGGRDRFAIHIRKQTWLCRHCGKGGGDAIGLVQFIDGIGFVEAVELLSGEDAARTRGRRHVRQQLINNSPLINTSANSAARRHGCGGKGFQ